MIQSWIVLLNCQSLGRDKKEDRPKQISSNLLLKQTNTSMERDHAFSSYFEFLVPTYVE
jgi:hypothetical protein